MKRYTLYKFPSYRGTPKDFNFKWIMWVYYFLHSFPHASHVWEYQDNKTNKYYQL